MKRSLLLVLPVLLVLGVCAEADKMDIHAMVVGDKIFGVQNSRQITTNDDGYAQSVFLSPNGKRVAYTTKPNRGGDKGLWQLSLANTLGGQTTTLFNFMLSMDELGNMMQRGDTQGEIWVMIPNYVHWSPDSKSIVAATLKISLKRQKNIANPSAEDDIIPKLEMWLQVYSSAGKQLKSILLPNAQIITQIEWSPDSKQIALVCWPPDSTEGFLLIANPNTGELAAPGKDVTGEVVSNYSNTEVEWVNNGQDIRYMSKSQEDYVTREYNLESRTSKVLDEKAFFKGYFPSPDGAFNAGLTPKKDSISITNTVSSKTIDITAGKDYKFAGWAPNSQMFAYTKAEDMKIGDGTRTGTFTSLWLAVPEDRKYNQMCLSLEYEKSEDDLSNSLSWSADSSKVAYIAHGRAYLLELGLREANTDEKQEAGFQLTEEEEKKVLSENAFQVLGAIKEYLQKNNNVPPPANLFADMIKPYLENKSALNRPGTDKSAFQYIPFTSIADIKDPNKTAIGFFDVGYNWKVVLYADWHYEVVPKDK